MIPESGVILTPAESERWRITKLAAALVRDYGVSPDLVMLDCREGVEHARRWVADRGRPT